jgi:hypothetical protein
MLEILFKNNKKLFYKKSSWIQKIKKNIDESKWSFQKLNTHNTIKKISLQKKINKQKQSQMWDINWNINFKIIKKYILKNNTG